MTSIADKLHTLGALMKTNLENKGITGLTGNEGLTTLANKINDISTSQSAAMLTVTASAARISVGGSSTITGTLTNNNVAVANAYVILSVNGSTSILTTNSNGVYTYTYTGTGAGTVNISIIYGNVSNSVTITDESHNYAISFSGNQIIQNGDSTTVTAMLTDNNVAVDGETLTYQIKHGSTVIDSGSYNTDNNGEISIYYTGTGVGDVDIVVSFGSLLQEIYEVEDLLLYRASVSASDTFDIILPNHFEITSTVTKTESSGAYCYYQTDNYDMGSLRGNGSLSVRVGSGNPFADNNTSIITVNNATTLRYEYDNGSHGIYANNNSATGTNSTAIGNFKKVFIQNYNVTNLKIKAL